MFKSILKAAKSVSAKGNKFLASVITDVNSNQCSNCVHFTPEQEGLICEAYPEGIPMDIFTGKVDHSKPVKGDNGIQFKQK